MPCKDLAYHHGDIKGLVAFCKKNEYTVDAMISSEVIEHIYDIDTFFKQLKEINNELHFVFGTSANEKNYFRKKKLKKQQYIAEHVGFNDFKGRKKKDTIQAFVKVRAAIIKKEFPALSDAEIEILSKNTRGKRKEAVLNTVFEYTISGFYHKQLNIQPIRVIH